MSVVSSTNTQRHQSAGSFRAGAAVRRPPLDGRAAAFTAAAEERRYDPPLLVLAVLAVKAIAVALWIWTPRHGLAAAVFFGSGSVVLYHLLVPCGSALGRVYTRFVPHQKEVWLTIDDGPDPVDTPVLLDLLDRHHARATFFVIGGRALRHPDLVAEIVRRGHEVAHHTHTHPTLTFWCATRRQVRAELDRGLAALEACAVQPRLFRAPVGIKNIFLGAELARRRMACVAWSIRSGDSVSRSSTGTVARVLRRVEPGAIILMHEGPGVPRPVRIRAIAGLLDGLSARGFACVVPRTAQLR